MWASTNLIGDCNLCATLGSPGALGALGVLVWGILGALERHVVSLTSCAHSLTELRTLLEMHVLEEIPMVFEFQLFMALLPWYIDL